MGWSRHDEDSRADYHRDRLKHEPRPDDPPARLMRKLTTAQDIAALVKTVDLITGATLIEHYARSEHQRIMLDAVAAGST